MNRAANEMNPTSMHLTSGHLTADQIDDFLIGDLAPEAEAHLDACDDCMARVAEAQAPLESFRAVSMAWSERRSATMPAVIPAQTSGLPKMAWGAIMTALVVGMAIPVMMHRNAQPVQNSPVAETAAAAPVAAAMAPVAEKVATAVEPKRVTVRRTVTQSEQIERDNRMLAAIDRELDVAVATPASFGLESPGGRAHARNRIAVQD